jgi:Fumarylacetoacetate (FAA) hydrolase family
VALERDGSYYDVEALEAALGSSVDVPGDRWDFQTRVVALGCAGLPELDARLLKGERPTAARIVDGFAMLAPFECERATFLQVDTRAGQLSTRVGLARSVTGQDDLVAVARGESPPDFEVGLGVLVGDDLSDASQAEAKHAIVGVAIVIDWFFRDAERAGRGSRGRSAQLGPWLVASAALGRAADLAASVSVGALTSKLGSVRDLGVSIEEAVAFASSEAQVRAGDLIGVGPFPASRGCSAAWHQSVTATVERVGSLSGTPVPRR